MTLFQMRTSPPEAPFPQSKVHAESRSLVVSCGLTPREENGADISTKQCATPRTLKRRMASSVDRALKCHACLPLLLERIKALTAGWRLSEIFRPSRKRTSHDQKRFGQSTSFFQAEGSDCGTVKNQRGAANEKAAFERRERERGPK
jgi:hypothetical protein